MANFNPSNYDQLVMLPIPMESRLAPGTIKHAINELVGKAHRSHR